jgi:hypothetical protein
LQCRTEKRCVAPGGKNDIDAAQIPPRGVFLAIHQAKYRIGSGWPKTGIRDGGGF